MIHTGFELQKTTRDKFVTLLTFNFVFVWYTEECDDGIDIYYNFTHSDSIMTGSDEGHRKSIYKYMSSLELMVKSIL